MGELLMLGQGYRGTTFGNNLCGATCLKDGLSSSKVCPTELDPEAPQCLVTTPSSSFTL